MIRLARSAVVVVLVWCAGCADDPALLVPDTVRLPSRVTIAPPSASIEERNGVVEVLVTGCDFTATGSGFVTGVGEVVTNLHVVDGASQVRVEFADGSRADVRRLYRHPSEDLARLAVATDDAPAFELFIDSTPSGAHLRVLGFPGGGPFTVTDGRLVSTLLDEGREVLYISAVVEPGNSGGPVLDDEGRVTGVVEAIMLKSGRGRAIPAAALPGRDGWKPLGWRTC